MKICKWCGTPIDRGYGAQYCDTKCRRNWSTSKRARDALSFIEVAVKIIDQDYKCAGRCNVYVYPRLLTQDHHIPKSLGGPHENHNVSLMCADCNNSKGSKDGDDWLRENKYWIPEETHSEEVAIRNLYSRYIEHYRLPQRAQSLIKRELEPHKEEMKYAPVLLQWLIKQGFETPRVQIIPFTSL